MSFKTPRSFAPGTGTRKSFQVTNPGAGNEWTVTIPAGKFWAFYNARCILATSSATANRASGLNIKDGAGNVLYVFEAAGTAEPASSSYSYGLFPFGGLNQSSFGGDSAIHVNQLPLNFPAGYIISSSTALIQAGDQYSSIFLDIEEWIL